MNILITGITGTIGTELARQLLEEGHTLRGLSRDEFKQSKFEYKNHVEMFLGDIRNINTVENSMRGIDTVIHTAALKHVDLMEKNINECIYTNVIGTENIILTQRKLGTRKIVFTSTDKACYPVNVYGNSKSIGEKLILSNNRNNIVVRYGNVLNSRGSIIGIFKEQLLKHKKIKITHEDMTRFWIKIEDAARYIIKMTKSECHGLAIPELKAASVVDLAKVIFHNICPGEALPFEIIGLRPGEKIHECLFTSKDHLIKNKVYERHNELFSNFSSVQLSYEDLESLVKASL